MSDRIAVMLNGRLQQFAPPQEVYRAPANRFVASFIGMPSMALLDGALSRDGDGWRFDAPGLSVGTAPLVDGAAAGPAAIGIRPEHVTIGTGPVRARVALVEQTGHENVVAVELPGGPRLTARTPAGIVPRMGETIDIGVDEGKLHVFAAGETGARLNRDAAPDASIHQTR